MKPIIPLIIILIVMGSGCTTNTPNPQTDLIVIGTPNIQANGPPNEYIITGNLDSKTNTNYKEINITITLLDQEGNKIGEKNETLQSPYIQSTINSPTPPTRVDIKINGAKTA